nr:MAG TPA: Scaffolding protein [Caudoviricetes sp.]
MKDFEFDLQLFAEGEAEVPATDATPTEPTGDVEGNDTPAQPADFDFGIDENGDVFFNGNRMFAFDGDDEPAPEPETQDSDEGQAEPTEPENATPEPQMYTVKVDGQEMQVPLEELLNGYQRQADYSRKTQALADERRQLQQQYAQYQQPQVQPEPQEPQQPQFTQAEYYNKLAEFAKGEVERNLGVEFDELNPVHIAALTDSVATIKAQIYEQQSIQKNFANVVNQFRQDPNFQEIDRYAEWRLQNMPYQQAVKIQNALNNYDADTVAQFMTAARNEYYGMLNAQHNQQNPPQQVVPNIPQPTAKPKPPVLEQAGSGTRPPTSVTQDVDFKAMGKMTNDQLVQLFQKTGLTQL